MSQLQTSFNQVAVTPIEAIWKLPALRTIDQELSSYETAFSNSNINNVSNTYCCGQTTDPSCQTATGCYTGRPNGCK